MMKNTSLPQNCDENVTSAGKPVSTLAPSCLNMGRSIRHLLALSSQFSALNPVREIWNTAIQNASTPPPARYAA